MAFGMADLIVVVACYFVYEALGAATFAHLAVAFEDQVEALLEYNLPRSTKSSLDMLLKNSSYKQT
jgi:hypothetical protein